MRFLLVLTLLLGSIATGCQNSEVTSTPQSNNASLPQNTSPSAPVTAQAPLSPSPSQATPSATSQRSCQISAYVIDKDPQGLNVRSAPNSNSNVIDKLPTTTVGVFVDLTASQGNWVQLSHAESPEQVEFQGSGWVYAPLLGTSTRGYGSNGVTVYASASSQSTTIGRIPPATGVKLLGCDRDWALVEYQQLKGWIAPDAQCPNSLTTCP